MPTIYDTHRDFYLGFVDQQLADPKGLAPVLRDRLTELLGDRIDGARVCDLACGEGFLSRHLSESEAREVLGIDISAELVAEARRRTKLPNVTFAVDDAQSLSTLRDASFDLVVSQMAIMDIPDHVAMFRAARRVLRSGGTFAFSLLHPAFQAPFHFPDQEPFLTDEGGQPAARVIYRYATEGHWQSGGTGVRGHMGAYHRMISTLLNDLLAARFALEQLDEPVVEGGGLWAEVPSALIVIARA